jgi:transposase-like protein
MAKQGLSIPKLVEQIPDEVSAYKFLEGLRWPTGPICPHCGHDKAYFLTPKDGTGRKTRTGSQSVRRVWKCADCRRQFSVLTGTVMHGTKISIRTWVFVLFEMVASKNGVSAREVERKYEVTPEGAWFMCHRIREGMKRDPLAGLLSGTVIADETWIGGAPKNRHRRIRNAERPANAPHTEKTAVFSLVHKETGEVRSQVVPNVRGNTLKAAIAEQVDIPNSVLHTDSAMGYTHIGWKFQDHQSVNHIMGEYVRGDVTSNHVEGYFSQLKRSIDGTHHAVSAEHLPRYLAEFDFRYSTRKLSDSDRMARLLGQLGGRRLTYEPLRRR